MRAYQAAGLLGVAADGGLHQGAVLAGLVAWMRPEQSRQIAVTLGAIEQGISHGKQCRRARRRDQRLMELAMRRFPFHVDRVVFRRPLLDLGEPVQGRNNPYFPVIIAILDGPPDQIDLDQDARMREVRQIIQRDRRDLVAPLFLGDDQAFRSGRGVAGARG